MEPKSIYFSNPAPKSWVEGQFIQTMELTQPGLGTIRIVNGVYSTKVCRKCGCKDLIELRSIERKRCSNCRRLIYWPLTEGQKPLL